MEAVHTVTLIHCHTVMSLPCGLRLVILSSSVNIAVLLNSLQQPLYIVSDSHYCPAHVTCTSCWFLKSVEALPHREVTLALSPSPCMHVSLLYQTRSLEDQLQLQEAANHQHRYRVYWFTLTWPIAITCRFSPSNYHCMYSTGTAALCVGLWSSSCGGSSQAWSALYSEGALGQWNSHCRGSG